MEGYLVVDGVWNLFGGDEWDLVGNSVGNLFAGDIRDLLFDLKWHLFVNSVWDLSGDFIWLKRLDVVGFFLINSFGNLVRNLCGDNFGYLSSDLILLSDIVGDRVGVSIIG